MENKKPILNDAVKIFSDGEIISRLLQIYPDQKKSKSGYEKVIKELRTTKPVRTAMEIEVTKVKDPLEPHEEYTDISGSKPKTKMSYSLEFLPWNKWLGMKIAKVSLLHYNYLDIVAYCLWEMTWMGFDQDKIATELKDLVDVGKKIKKDLKK